MLETRLLNPADAAMFSVLRLRAITEEPAAFLEAPEEVSTRPVERYFENGWLAGAFLDGTLVATAGLFRHKGIKVAHKGTVWGVYTAPEARGRKLGHALITLLLREAEAAGLEQVLISTNVLNPVTRKLYNSLGFEDYGVEKHIIKLADGSYVDDVWMVKFLK